MPTDGLTMPKGQLCILGQYTNSSWENYWQGETKRSNFNIGTFNMQSTLVLYVTAQAGHTWRSTTTIDHNAYIFDYKLIYSDVMPVSNVLDYSARLGFIKTRFQAELWFDAFTGLSGDDIRYNEMPQATNKMAASQVGVYRKYFVTKRLAFLATLSQVLSGRNVGEALTGSVGTTYFLNINE